MRSSFGLGSFAPEVWGDREVETQRRSNMGIANRSAGMAVLAITGLVVPIHAQGPPVELEIARTFLLLGQSNMEGEALASELIGPNAVYLDPQSGVQIFNREDCTGSLAGCTEVQCRTSTVPPTWQVLEAGVNANRCYPWKIGPEVSLGASLSAHYEQPIYLVKYAVGGTFLNSAAAGCFTWNAGNGCLLDAALDHLQAARTALPPGKLMRVAGVFWEQGVNDSGNFSNATQYAANLEDFIVTLRSELVERSFAIDSTVPFVISHVPDFIIENHAPNPDYPRYFDTVRCAQQNAACSMVDVGIFDPVEATGYASTHPNYDPYHMDAPDQVYHGIGLFEAFQELGCPTLSMTSCEVLYENTPTPITFRISSPAHSGMTFRLLGSNLGKQPGVPIGSWMLNLVMGVPPGYFWETFDLSSPYLTYPPSVLVGGVPKLDSNGEATVIFTPLPGILPPGGTPGSGKRFHHAFIVFDGSNAIVDVSNTVSLSVYYP